MLAGLGFGIMAPEPIYLATKMCSFLVWLAGHALVPPNTIEISVNNYPVTCGSLINYRQKYSSIGIHFAVPI